MEFSGMLKYVILVCAFVVPVVIVIAVYKTLFSGLRSISASKKPAAMEDGATNPEASQNKGHAEN